MIEVIKAPKHSPAKTDSCNPFHNRPQDRTKQGENYTVLHLGISKDREWAAKAPRLASSSHTVQENDYALGDQPNCQYICVIVYIDIFNIYKEWNWKTKTVLKSLKDSLHNIRSIF